MQSTSSIRPKSGRVEHPPDAPKTVSEAPEIQKELNYLTNTVEDLEGQLERLGARLSPVRRLVPSDPESATPPLPPLCDVGESIRASRCKLNRLQSTLEQLTESLAL